MYFFILKIDLLEKQSDTEGETHRESGLPFAASVPSSPPMASVVTSGLGGN